MSAPARPTPSSSSLDLCDLDLFSSGFPHDLFVTLRRDSPVWFHPATVNVPGGEGFWVLSRYADVLSAATDSEAFSSVSGGGREGGGTLIEDLPLGYAGTLLNMTDDPFHQRFRAVLTPSVSPRAIARMEADLSARSAAIVDSAVERGEIDLLVDVAAELPLQAAAALIGVPQEDRHLLIAWADATLDHDDRDLGGTSERAAAAAAAMFEYGDHLIESRRSDPGDDLLSQAVHAVIDDVGGPRRLRHDELQLLFSLLVAAGTETTRNTIAVGVAELAEHPDAWAGLAVDTRLIPAAVEEMLRWASSTPYNRRTATRDVSVGGELIMAGDKVTLWWASANRDESEFDEPFTFDVGRTPNRHLAFGHGSHFCLGARLARLEVRVIVEALLARVERIERRGPTEWTRSNKHTGVRHLPVELIAR